MKNLEKISKTIHIITSLTGMFWIVYLLLLTFSIGVITDPGNIHQPQFGADSTTRFMLYLLQHPGLITFAILNVSYSTWRGFSKSKEHLNWK